MKTVLEFCRLAVQAGDSRAIQRLMLQVAGTMFLQSYRAGKYYNYDRDGDKIAIDLILPTYKGFSSDNV
jgi:hypothetical protein